MKKIRQLKKLKVTKKDLELCEQNPDEWAKSKFNKGESQCGVCTYLAIFPDGEKDLFFVAFNGNVTMINVEDSGIVEVGDFHNGYCEFGFGNGEKSVFAGTLTKVPCEVEPYLDQVYADPCSIADIPEEILKGYCEELCYVGSNSLAARFIKLKEEDNLLAALMRLPELEQENGKYMHIAKTLYERYVHDEASEKQ